MLRALRPRFAILLFVALFSASCGGGGGDKAPGSVPDPQTGDGTTGIHLEDYAQNGSIGMTGGSVAIPGGPSLSVPLGALGTDTGLALRPAKTAPVLPAGWQAVSTWYDAATSRSDVLATPGTTLTLSVPITPPAGSEASPGLQLLASLGGMTVPIDGVYEAASGQFVVKVLGLPPVFSFCVAFNSHIQRTKSTDISGLRKQKPLAEGGWSTVSWVIDWDDQLLTKDEIENVFRWGQQAATIYSSEGFKEPFLYKEAFLGFDFWHLHLIPSGSNYNSNHDATANDLARRFGRLNLAVLDLRQPTTNPYGGGYSILAHEMFHAVFESYHVPYRCFSQVENGVTYCYQSNSGFNEGLATAVAYHLEQGGEAQPRPDLSPDPLERPFGFVNVSNMAAAYQNQDFIIYLLRMGSLSTIRQLVEALGSAVIPATAKNRSDGLLAYATALDASTLGFPDPFHKVYAAYTADRAYIRTSAGHIWPDEPNAESPGAADTWAPSLFPEAHTIVPGDCTITDTESYCTVTLKDVEPLSSRMILLDMTTNEGQLPPGYQMASLTLKVTVEAGSDQTALWIFGEETGKGSPDGRVGDLDGKEVKLADAASKWNTAKILVVHGASAKRDITVTVNLLAGELSEACQEASEWMCKCQASGANVGCAAYDIAAKQLCANVTEGSTCDEQCFYVASGYIEAYQAEDPSAWNMMCSANPR